MMANFKQYNGFKQYDRAFVDTLISPRAGEQKLGEKIQVVDNLDDMATNTARFVLLGIPEDIGVRANHGIGGTQTTWLPALRALLNMQSNAFLQGDEILLLGAFELEESEGSEIDRLRQQVAALDQLVYPLIERIVAAGKIPVVVGGGHNNAYGLIRGAATALELPINVVNIDAHTDLRPAEGRHSGNGFRYAINEAYLKQYRIFGLAENYVHAPLLHEINAGGHIRAFYFRDLLKSNQTIRENWEAFIDDLPEPCGLELDLDSLSGVLASAASPSGFALNDIRRLLLSEKKKFRYLHLCEGAVELSDGRQDPLTAKTIAFLISDFIAGQQNNRAAT